MNSTLKNQLVLHSQNNLELKVRTLNERILFLEQDKADLQSEVFNLRNQLETHLNFANAEIEQYKIRLSNSGITTIANTSPRRYNPSMASELSSPVNIEGGFPSRYSMDSLAFSKSPYNSGVPNLSYHPTIMPTQSIAYSTERSPENNQIGYGYHQSSFTARDSRMFSPTIPEV